MWSNNEHILFTKWRAQFCFHEVQSLWDVYSLGRRTWSTSFWRENIWVLVLKPKVTGKWSCWSKAKLEYESLLLLVTMNRTSETGEDVNIIILLYKSKIKEHEQDSTWKAFCLLFPSVHKSHFLPPCTRCVPDRCCLEGGDGGDGVVGDGGFHWGSSLSVSQSHLNTRVTLEKGRLSIQGDWNSILIESPITSIWKWNIIEITVREEKTATLFEDVA